MAGFGDSRDSIRLNITPMMDVFSILITFLLMSYSTDPVNHDLGEGLELPKSSTLTGLDEIPSLTVTQREILINGKTVAPIVGGDVPENYRSQGAIQPVFEELEKLKKANDRVLRAQGKVKKLGTLTMEMDKGHDFLLAKRLMLSAQQAEFLTFKLLVKKTSQ